MRAARRQFAAVVLIVLVTAARSDAVEPRAVVSASASARIEPSPLQDDASLHDVACIGKDLAWTVGDRGVIWKTSDGGASWQFQASGVDCALKSVCMLSDRIGWVAGGGVVPYTRLGFGIVLFTYDGGVTWNRTTTIPLPAIEYVRFFNMQEGVIAGASDTAHPTGVLTTHDGGKTWRNVEGTRQPGWRSADFLRPDLGVAAGQRGAVGRIDGKLLDNWAGRVGLQNLHDLKLNADETGWMVGDGGLALRTANRGVVWKETAAPLPVELRNVTDFRSVACRGPKVWLAGSPGSLIWHSPDDGHTWQRQRTGQSTPLARVRFASDETGWAVGAFGSIIRTNDGGLTWTNVRSPLRRAAIVAMHAHPQRVSFPLLAKEAADLGYRSVVLLPARGDVGSEAAVNDLDLKLCDAVVSSGGSTGEFGWQFPIGIPDLDHDAAKLLAEWNRVTEGKLQEVLLGRIVAQIRTWRPDILVLDEPPPDDAATRLLNEAVLAAVKQSADPTWHLAHAELAALEPWSVKRVFLRVTAGSSGHAVVDPHEFSPRLRGTILDTAVPARSRLIAESGALGDREEYRVVFDSSGSDAAASSWRDFFAGLSLVPGSEARRALDFDDGIRTELAEKLAQRRRNFQMAAKHSVDDPRLSAQLIGQLRETTAGLRSDQAALQLLQLAESYRRAAKWDLADATLIEMVSQYPHEPSSAVAMRLLFQTWAGAEPSWQRLRKIRVEKTTTETNSAALYETFEKVENILRVDPSIRETITLDQGPDPLKLVSHAGSIELSGARDLHAATLRHWQDQAFRMAALIRAKTPALYVSPEIQFPLSALCRQRGMNAHSLRFLGRAGTSDEPAPDDAWSIAAASEAQLSQGGGSSQRTLKCLKARVPPVLDGVLSDDCWQNAKEMRLTAPQNAGERAGEAITFLAYDAEHLYFAASVPRAPGVSYSGPMKAGRSHDADLTGHDRIVFAFDVDRDYATWYTIAIDERGWVNEKCWDDSTWNPNMWIEVAADETHWRIEGAIPFEEMVAPSPRREPWGAGVVRVIPALGVQGWTHPSASEPRPESFGAVRFE